MSRIDSIHRKLLTLIRLHSDPSKPLPSARSLADRWRVSDGTVLKAMQRCLATGALKRRRAKVYVTARTDVTSTQETTSATIQPLHVLVTKRKPSPTFQRALEKLVSSGFESRFAHCVTIGETELFLERRHAKPREPILLYALSPEHHTDLLRRLREAGTPVVSMDQAFPWFSSLQANVTEIYRRGLKFLADAGHARIAILREIEATSGSRPDRANHETATFAAHHCGLDPGKLRISTTTTIAETLHEWMRQKQPPTALFLRTLTGNTEAIFQAAHSSGIRIPEDLSLLHFGPVSPSTVNGVGITHLYPPYPQIAQMIRHLLEEQIAFYKARGLALKPLQLYYGWQLAEGQSVARRHDLPSLSLGGENSERGYTLVRQWPSNVTERKRAARRLNTTGFSDKSAHHSYDRKFSCLDLAQHTNRLLNKQHSWFGDHPLLHLSEGRHVFHGIPVEIPAFSRSGPGAIVMRSASSNPRTSKRFSDRVEIAIGQSANEIYFLHGGGYIRSRLPFARYIVEYSCGGDPVILPIAGAARLSGADSPGPSGASVNLQDWWPSYPQSAMENALPIVILPPSGDPFEYERYLYLFRWINPSPGEVIEKLVIEADPSRKETLALLALTLVQD